MPSYTTDDEIAFLRNRIAPQGYDLARLEKLRASYEARDWTGNGMCVDKDAVLAELDALIACARAAASGAVIIAG